MKRTAYILLPVLAVWAIFLGSASGMDSADEAQGKLTIVFYASGTTKGMSYPSRMKVYVDGTHVGESGVKDQKSKNRFNVTVPQGSHSIKCQVWALYKGDWQERTVSNGYAFDWTYETVMDFGRKNKLNLEFSIGERKVMRH